MPFQLKRIRSVLVKVETSEGVDAVPAGIDALRLIEAPRISFGAEVENDRPDLDNQLLDEEDQLEPSGKWAEISMRLQLRGLGSAYNGTTAVAEIHALKQGAGFSAVFSATPTPNWVFDTASTGLKSLTAKLWQGTDTGVHILHTLLGARVSRLAYTFGAGKPVIVEAALRGIYTAVSDTAIIAPAYPSTTNAPRFSGANSWGLGALTGAAVRESSIVVENNLVARLSGNGGDALAGFAITGRKLSHTARFEAARISDYNAFLKWADAVKEALAIDVPGGTGTQYNRVKFDADRAGVLSAPTYEEDGGIMLFGVSGKLGPGGTNRCKVTFD